MKEINAVTWGVKNVFDVSFFTPSTMCLERRSIIPRIKHSIKGFSAVWYVLVMILARN